MKKKFLVTCVGIMCCFMITSCGKSNSGNQGKDPLTGQEMSSSSDEGGSSEAVGGSQTDESNTGMGEGSESFESMLGEAGNSAGIVDYINTNIGNASDMDVRRYLGGLLGYGEDIRDIDFTGLDESKQYMPEDMIAFMELMKLESDTPSMVMSDEENRRVIGLTLSEMLERALLFEQHLKKYPNEVSSEAAQRLYQEIATNAITGGYDKIAGIEHYYKGDTPDVIDKDALQYYEQFAKANPESNLGAIVKDYTDVLEKSSFKINDDMEKFYYDLYERLQITDENAQTGTTESEGSIGNNSKGRSVGMSGGSGQTGTRSGSTGMGGSTGQTGTRSGSTGMSGSSGQSGMGTGNTGMLTR